MGAAKEVGIETREKDRTKVLVYWWLNRFCIL
jgi:hypothetical protein